MMQDCNGTKQQIQQLMNQQTLLAQQRETLSIAIQQRQGAVSESAYNTQNTMQSVKLLQDMASLFHQRCVFVCSVVVPF